MKSRNTRLLASKRIKDFQSIKRHLDPWTRITLMRPKPKRVIEVVTETLNSKQFTFPGNKLRQYSFGIVCMTQ